MKTVFLTYATDKFIGQAENLARTAKLIGFDESLVYTQNDISKSDFYERNSEVLKRSRGGGYWLWKPYLISLVLNKLDVDDVLFYSDAGRTNYYEFTSFPKNIVEAARSTQEGFLLGPEIPHLGTVENWTKRDCLILMNADNEKMLNRPQMHASPSVWTPTSAAKRFLNLWTNFCSDKRIITDDPNVCGYPNHPKFKDHRHDQSVLTILAHQENAPRMIFSQTLVHKLIEMRPFSEIGQTFYKRPQNLEDLMKGDNPYLLAREFIRLKRF